MERIKTFEQFTVNEGAGIAPFLAAVLKGDIDIFSDDQEAEGTTDSDSANGTYTPTTAYNAVPGNDDFTLYIQHQQGIAGAAGLIRALNGTGQMAPATISTKNGLRYANLVGNVPSDKPQVKNDIIAALNKGDQRTAAALFLNVWKEKWFSKQAEAKTAINDPKNKTVKDAITKASAKHGVPFDFAITIANIESGFNPKAGNASYKGLFAMQPNSTYGGAVTPMGSKWSDPYVNAENGIKLLKDSIGQLKKNLGKDWASLKVGSWANNLA
jgi:hypothetical protein